jgi:hypothetical protein
MRNLNIYGGKSMKYRILLVFLALVLVVSLAAFAACESKPKVYTSGEWPGQLSVASQGPATPAYPIDVGWTVPLEQDTGMKVRLLTEESLPVSFTWLKRGTLDIGFADMGALSVPSGLDVFATRELGPVQMRIFWPHGRGGRGFAVRGDSDIETPYDITPETKLIYHSPVLAGPFGKMWVEALLAWANLTPDDIPEENWIEAPSIESTFELLKEGRGDVVVGWPSSPPWLEVEAAPHGLAWIDLDAKADPEAAARYLAVDSAGTFGPMDKGAPSAIGVNMLLTIPSMVVMADKDTELVYNLCKWLDENYDKFKDAHPYCAAMTVENLVLLAEMEFVPLHDGAVKYLEELGLWTDDHETRRQQNIDLLDRYEQAYVEALDLADDQGIEVDPANEEWLELWDSYREDEGLPKFKLFVTFP